MFLKDKGNLMSKIPKLVELQVPITLRDVLKKWSHQAGEPKEFITKKEQETAYLGAINALFVEFSLNFEKYEDEEFVRILRFFRDAGFLKRVSEESAVFEQYKSLEDRHIF